MRYILSTISLLGLAIWAFGQQPAQQPEQVKEGDRPVFTSDTNEMATIKVDVEIVTEPGRALVGDAGVQHVDQRVENQQHRGDVDREPDAGGDAARERVVRIGGGLVGGC